MRLQLTVHSSSALADPDFLASSSSSTSSTTSTRYTSRKPAMASAPDYNRDMPSSLLAAGTLQGRAVAVDTSSIRPCQGRPVFLANLRDERSLDVLCGGQARTVAIKATEDDRKRAPRNPRREALLLAKLHHPNVRRASSHACSLCT